MTNKTDTYIVLAWEEGSTPVYVKTFNIETEREEMMDSYDFARDNYPKFILTSIENIDFVRIMGD